eukprot:gene273-6688_t
MEEQVALNKENGKKEMVKKYQEIEGKHNHIGEFNGKPIFIDIDSVLMHCLLHPLIDTIHGLEIVQIINFIELFIERFERNVILIFFENLENAWKNPSEKLARNIIKQHFININIVVKTFKSWETEEFHNYVEINSPAFTIVSNPNKLPKNCSKDSEYLFMHQITHFVYNNINCITQNDLRYEPEGIYGFQFNGSTSKVLNIVLYEEEKKECSIDFGLFEKLNKISNFRNQVWTYACIKFLQKHPKEFNFTKILLLQSFLLEILPLQFRSQMVDDKFSNVIIPLLEDAYSTIIDIPLTNDIKICDLFDGRLIHVIWNHLVSIKSVGNFEDLGMNSETSKNFEHLWSIIVEESKSNIELFPIDFSKFEISELKKQASEESEIEKVYHISSDFVGPLVNDVNKKLEENSLISKKKASGFNNLFIEKYHWHSDKLFDDGVRFVKTDNNTSGKAEQRYSAFMQKYAASLSGGKIVKREIITPVINNSKTEEKNEKKVQSGGKKKGGKKQLSKKDQIIADNLKKQLQKEINDINGKIDTILKFELEDSIKKLQNMCDQTTKDELYIVPLRKILQKCEEAFVASQGNEKLGMRLLTALTDLCNLRNLLTVEDFEQIIKSLKHLGFGNKVQDFINEYASSDIATKLRIEQSKVVGKYSFPRFLFKFGGESMKRETESTIDPRVKDFAPDKWQVELLDIVDKKESCLVVAPTSSGKTFISYYCMENVMKWNKSNKTRKRVVYVLPTKALVNQVSGDIYKRYGLVFGVFTRDYRRNVENCEILITVPQCLEILLMSPSQYNWIGELEWIVFDEVHFIGLKDGDIWERNLRLINCPFLALSATIGNPETLKDWMNTVSPTKVNLVQYNQRYSDLCISAYNLEKETAKITQVNMPSQDSLIKIHPIASMKYEYYLNSDLEAVMNKFKFSPSETLELVEEMEKIDFSGVPKLAESFKKIVPENYFSKTCSIDRKGARLYQDDVKKFLLDLISNGLTKEVDTIFTHFSTPLKSLEKYEKVNPKAKFLNLLIEMRSQGMLPALAFSFSRSFCVEMAIELTISLEELEKEEMISRGFDDTFMTALQKKKEEFEQNIQKQLQSLQKSKEKPDYDSVDLFDERLERYEGMIRDIKAKYSFVSQGEDMASEDKEFWLKRLLWKTKWKEDHPLLRALQKGIGVHHSGLPKEYKDYVETLFRGKHIKLVFATGTLAYGVNMPCKAVIFVSESKYLSPLIFNQMIGRAGRRGYDKIGHVVFFNYPLKQVANLLSSKVQSLKGNYGMSATLALRMCILLTQSEKLNLKKVDHELILKKCKNLLKPSFGYNEIHSQDQIAHHFRFALEFLLRNGYINNECETINLTGLVAHLWYTEPSNFVFARFLESKAMMNICEKWRNPESSKDEISKELLTIVAHMFNRYPSDKEETSLKSLDKDVVEMITNYNKESMKVYVNYLKTFSKTEIDSKKNYLPLSKTLFESKDDEQLDHGILKNIKETSLDNKVRSPFMGLSGLDDNFNTTREIVDSRRSDIFVNEKVIPICEYKNVFDEDIKLSSYIIHFYMSGDYSSLIKDYNIKSGAAWSVLKDWSLMFSLIVNILNHLIENDKKTNESEEIETAKKVSLNTEETWEDIEAEGDAEDEEEDIDFDSKKNSIINEVKSQKKKKENKKKTVETPKEDDLPTFDDSDLDWDASGDEEDEKEEEEIEEEIVEEKLFSYEDMKVTLEIFEYIQLQFDSHFKAIHVKTEEEDLEDKILREHKEKRYEEMENDSDNELDI